MTYNYLFLIIVLYGVNTLVSVSLYEHNVHLSYELYMNYTISKRLHTPTYLHIDLQ